MATNILIFDILNKKVTLNGVEKDYTGIFPTFNVGVNSFTVDTTRTAAQWDLVIRYKKYYL